MTKRKHQILTDAERAELVGIPVERDALARLYTFEPSDINIIGIRREPRNWLGVSLQLALLRYPGITLAQLLQDSEGVPAELLAFVADQLGLRPSVLADYASRNQTMTDHARELAGKIGVRGPVRDDIPFMIDAAANSAWSTEKGLIIARGVVSSLRETKILLPSISTIERTSLAGRARARKLAAQALVACVSEQQILALDALFADVEGDATNRLTWLKSIPVAVKPDHIRQILERLRFVRQIGVPADTASVIHVDRYRQFVREGRASASYMIERYAPARRQATLIAFLVDLEERLTDAALEMADKLIGSIFTRAKNTQARNYAATSRDVSRLMQIFRMTIDALTAAVDSGDDPIERLDASVGWVNLLKIRPEVANIAETANIEPLIVAADRYATLRKFAPELIEALEFRASKGSAKTIAALDLLRQLNQSGKRDIPPDAPMPFRKEWQKLVVDSDGKINRRLWEVATFAHLRNKLRSGDVWVERSAGYRRFDSYLLSEPQAAPAVSALGLPPTADQWLAERGGELDSRLKKFAQKLKRGQLEGVRFNDGRLQISPVRMTTPPEAEALSDRIDALMPRIRITELLHDVASDTGFLEAFTNLRTGQQCPNESALLATILADGTNLGLSRMAAASEGVTRDQLMWTHDAYIREDTYRSALERIINAHHNLPFAHVWGSGTTSSSDGQFFRGAKRGASGGDINARYGVDYGFNFYTHNSDQRAISRQCDLSSHA